MSTSAVPDPTGRPTASGTRSAAIGGSNSGQLGTGDGATGSSRGKAVQGTASRLF